MFFCSLCDTVFSLGQIQPHDIGQFLFQVPDEKDYRSLWWWVSLFISVSVYWYSYSFSPSGRRNRSCRGRRRQGRLLLPIDFPVPFSGSLVSPNYSSAFSGSLGQDISHQGGLIVLQSPRGGLGRWLSDNTSVGTLESNARVFFLVVFGLILVVYDFLHE